MTEKNDTKTTTLPPHAQLIEMATAHWISRIVYVAAKLSLADHLAGGPKSADELAGPTGTHAPSLYRLMRTLAHLGLLSEVAGQRFALTPLGEALKKNAPGAARATILTLASDWCANGFGELLYSVQTRKSGLVLPPGNTPHPGKVLDMMMLVGPGGRERTEQEYGTLLGQAGFRLTRLVPTQSAVSVIEAVVA